MIKTTKDMKAILEFNLDEPEDADRFRVHAKAFHLALAILDISKLEIPNNHRKKIQDVFDKYEINPDTLLR